MNKYKDALYQLLENVSDNGFCEQMLRNEFLNTVLGDNEMIEYILENFKVRSKTVTLLNAYRENKNNIFYDYSFEKSLVLKYINEDNKSYDQRYQCENIIEIIPTTHIVSDKEFLNELLNLSPNPFCIFYKNLELIEILQKENWYIDKIIALNKLDLKDFQTFDFSNMDRNIKLLSNLNNYTYLSPELKINPLVINHMLDLLDKKVDGNSNNKIKIIEAIALEIDTLEDKIRSGELKGILPIGYESVTPENYKNVFIDSGVFFENFEYSDKEKAKVLLTRTPLVIKEIKENEKEPIILSKLVGNQSKFGIEFSYKLISDFKNIIREMPNSYSINNADIKLLKSIFKKICAKDDMLEEKMKVLISNGYDISTTNSKIYHKKVCLTVMETMEPLLFERVMMKDSPIKEVKERPMKF